MTLTRKLVLILVTGLLTAWAVIFTELHFSVTENFQAFDTYTRDSIRKRMDAAVSQQAMLLHAETRQWMAEQAANGHSAQDPYDSAPDEFPADTLRESDLLAFVDNTGRLRWSVSKDGSNLNTVMPDDKRQALQNYLHQANNGIGQQFFLNGTNGPQLAYSTPTSGDGHLIVAHTVNDLFYHLIAPAEQPPDVLYSADMDSAPSELSVLLTAGGMPTTALFDIEQATSRAYMRYDDPFGVPVLLLAVDSPRFLTTLPNNPGVVLFWWIVVITLVFVLLMTKAVDRLLSKPLQRLRNLAREMSLDGLAKIDTSGSNEIEAIEKMFAALAAERENRETRLRSFARAVEAADDAIAIISWDGTMHYVNSGYEKLTGRSEKELMASNSWWETVFATNSMRTRSENKQEWEGEVQVKRPDGELRAVEVNTYQLNQEEGEQAYFVIALHDITEKNAQIAEIQRLATAVQSIEDCIIIADAEGRISYANPAYEKRCGKTLEEMKGIATSKLSHAASPISVYEDLQRTVTAGKVWRGELQAVFQNGRRVIDEAIISPVFNEQGEAVNYVTTLHDVTDRVTMEEDLRLAKNRVQQANDELEERVAQRTEELRSAKDTAEQANVAKSAFLATVSHEIRTPLNGILGMLDLLTDYPLDNEQKKLLSSADTSANLLLALINDILDFSKIEAGELRLDETSVSLREVTESVVLALAGTAHHKKLTLQSNLDPTLPPNIVVDGIRLQQILLNLIGNAIKFTNSEGRPGVVSLEVDKGPIVAGNPSLRLRVRDNGIGIPPEAIETLFKPFTQAESSTTRRFGGTGLGLSISSRLAGLMGGEIKAESTLGEGSTFTVLIPLAAAPDDSSTSLPRMDIRSSGTNARWSDDRVRAHLLVAEDNRINQDVIRLQLKAIGFSCDLADDGEAALTLWRQNDYDLVLTDCHMPNMDGFELAKAIRAEEAAEQHTPIIALTANVLSEEAAKCRNAGMDECLTKPIERGRLDKALTVHLTAKAVKAARKSDKPPKLTHQGEDKKRPRRRARLSTRTPKGLLDMEVFTANIGDDRNVQCELLRRFAIEAEKNLAENRAALEQKDANTLKCNAHKLKSAARTLGAERLAEVCVEIEATAKEEDFLILTELLEQKAMLITLLGQQISEEVATTSADADPVMEI